MRVNFCGVIEGSVVLRPGETEEEAIQRAQETLQELLSRQARSLKSVGYGDGPVVGLEPA